MFNNRVSGIIGVGVDRGNFNADFDGMPRQNQLGDFYSNDKALKYATRVFWLNFDEKVLIFKSFKQDPKGNIVPNNLEERYTSLYGKNALKTTDKKEVLNNLFENIDVKNFGVAFPVTNNNFSITGVAQLDIGVNKMEETSVEDIQQLSPFQNKENDAQSSLGVRHIVDEAHYFYNLTVNPSNIKPYAEFGLTYEEEDYIKLKEGLMNGVNSLNTQSKIGAYNEFGLFVKFKEGSKLYLPCLAKFVSFKYDKNGKNEIDLSALNEVLERNMDQIESVEVIYDKETTELVGLTIAADIKGLY